MKQLPDGTLVSCCCVCDNIVEEIVPIMDMTDTIIIEEEYLYRCGLLDVDIDYLGEIHPDCPLPDAEEGDEE